MQVNAQDSQNERQDDQDECQDFQDETQDSQKEAQDSITFKKKNICGWRKLKRMH